VTGLLEIKVSLLLLLVQVLQCLMSNPVDMHLAAVAEDQNLYWLIIWYWGFVHAALLEACGPATKEAVYGKLAAGTTFTSCCGPRQPRLHPGRLRHRLQEVPASLSTLPNLPPPSQRLSVPPPCLGSIGRSFPRGFLLSCTLCQSDPRSLQNRRKLQGKN
jgi:hypothetical protein